MSREHIGAYYDYEDGTWKTPQTVCGFSCMPCFPASDNISSKIEFSEHKGGKSISDAHPCMDLDCREVFQGTTSIQGGRKIRYAYICQKGYHPSKVNWVCQDACSVVPGFLSEQDSFMMCVFDGHGMVGEGDRAAQIANQLLPKCMHKAMSRSEEKRMSRMFESAFEETSAALCSTLRPETGCAALCALVRGSYLYVANCGDTRAVLGRASKGMEVGEEEGLQAVPLSCDHKAFREDERMRILSDHDNTEVLTFGMKDGKVPVSSEFGSMEDPESSADPPRIWIKGKTFPGCSYTRSLGDAAAKKVGIIATPEIARREVSAEDRVLVLCTDGVTEFLSNDAILRICQRNLQDPLDAAEELVQTAFNWYVDDDGWTDDITAMVAYIEK